MVDRYSWQLGSAYATELVDDLHPEELPVFVEPLTPRERAVLEYLPTMMTNTRSRISCSYRSTRSRPT